MRVWRSKSSRGVPRKGDLKMPDIPADWLTSTEVLPHPPGTINPLTMGQAAEQWIKGRENRKAWRKGLPTRVSPLKLPDLPVFVVVSPKRSLQAETEAWTMPKRVTKENRNEVIAYKVVKALYPFKRHKPSHDVEDGWCKQCNRVIPYLSDFAISERDRSNDGNEMRVEWNRDDEHGVEDDIGDNSNATEREVREFYDQD